MINYNPVIIPSKHIYGKPTINTLNNFINGIETTYNTFKENDNNALFSFSVNFPFNTKKQENTENDVFYFDKESFEQNNYNLKNITYFNRVEAQLSLHLVKFETEIILNSDFMLNNLIVKTSYDIKDTTEKQISKSEEIYNGKTITPSLDEFQNFWELYFMYYPFYIINNEDEFDSLEGNTGKFALIRIGKTHFKMICEISTGLGFDVYDYMNYVCYNRKIEFYANNLTTAIEKIGSGNDFSISSNEFLNNINTITANGEKIEIQKYIANNIIENYKNGKKRINIQVGYGDYYYKDGAPYGGIKNKKQLLKEGDIVQPMKWNGNKDIPLILKRDGSSAIFEITSAELNTQGAPKLFLELLEKTT